MIYLQNISARHDCEGTNDNRHVFEYEGVSNGDAYFWCRQCGGIYSITRNEYGDISLIKEHPDNG